MEKINIKIITYFLLIQPLLDISVVLIPKYPVAQFIRGSFLIYIIVYLLIKKISKKTTISIIGSIILMIIYILYNLLYLRTGLTTSISNTLKLFYLLFSILFFINLENKKEINKYLTITLLEYITIYLLSYIFRIGYSNYPKGVKKIGYRGLYNSINEISAILIILYYLVFNYLKENKKKLLLLVSVLIFIISYLTGTKVLFGGLIIVIGYHIIPKLLIKWKRQNIKNKLLSLLVSIIVLGLITILFLNSNTYKNMLVQAKFFKVKNILSLEGINKVIFNDRLRFLNMNYNIYNKENIITKFLGIGFNYKFKTVEMDLFDILFRYGIVGLILTLSSIIYSIYKSKNNFIRFGLIFILLISMTSGHVLVSPAVSIYLGIILLCKGEEYEKNSSSNN